MKKVTVMEVDADEGHDKETLKEGKGGLKGILFSKYASKYDR